MQFQNQGWSVIRRSLHKNSVEFVASSLPTFVGSALSVSLSLTLSLSLSVCVCVCVGCVRKKETSVEALCVNVAL